MSVRYDDVPFNVARQDSSALRVAAANLLHDGLDTGDPQRPFFVGHTRGLEALASRLDGLAASDAPVLLLGEKGTGKELFARALHRRGPRGRKPFVTVDCAAFPESLLEAELFGSDRPMASGAGRRREGRVRAADGGTLFIDEIAEMSVALQGKLLRLIQDGELEALGSSVTERVDVCIVATTHRDLGAMVELGGFRPQLYDRIRATELRLPPLRDRSADLPALVWLFLERLAPSPTPDRTPPRLGAGVWEALVGHDFPGNLRELEHVLQHAVLTARGGTIELQHLPRELQPFATQSPSKPIPTLREALAVAERAHIVRALTHNGGRKVPTAATLGVSRKCLWEKIRLHGVEPREWSPARESTPVPGAQVDFSVLLVEDNAADARIVCELLGESTRPRYQVRRVSRLVEVGRSIDDVRPDVIVLDLQLPDSAGLATVEHVRALDDDVAIVVLTGAWEPGLERGALRGGADVMVSKDHVDAASLSRVLDYAVAQRRRLHGRHRA